MRTLKQSKLRLLTLLISFMPLVAGLSLNADAQSKSKKKRTTSINFEDELIEGNVKKPELMYLLQKKQFNFKRLIKLRNDFRPEMYQTAEEIQSDGSID